MGVKLLNVWHSELLSWSGPPAGSPADKRFYRREKP